MSFKASIPINLWARSKTSSNNGVSLGFLVLSIMSPFIKRAASFSDAPVLYFPFCFLLCYQLFPFWTDIAGKWRKVWEGGAQYRLRENGRLLPWRGCFFTLHRSSGVPDAGGSIQALSKYTHRSAHRERWGECTSLHPCIWCWSSLSDSAFPRT